MHAIELTDAQLTRLREVLEGDDRWDLVELLPAPFRRFIQARPPEPAPAIVWSSWTQTTWTAVPEDPYHRFAQDGEPGASVVHSLMTWGELLARGDLVVMPWAPRSDRVGVRT
jgi:hypothetical protein